MRILILILAFMPTLAFAQVSGSARAIDGNTLEVGGEQFRLVGMDAPDLGQTCRHYGHEWPCGREARNVLERTIAGRQVTCFDRGRDAQGREVAACRVGPESLSLGMLVSGMALVDVGSSDAFTDAEAAARAAKRGLWAGEFVRPAEWRNGARLQPVAAAARCPIKGTVVGGKRIYLPPNHPGYAAATVTESRGERWFCSEVEAIKAGWELPE